ncbi:MAG TPA: hypothetical protein P5567_05920 [Kiritimatiellia bacterium]|nr:hypothetical protein [Kiritimatiellia bacterium]HRZ11974.1 hypothetical protein [Kiritimatiellia bacterium]HSA17220.1 hypothetical protein [Kiritimatiellia bacterium]
MSTEKTAPVYSQNEVSAVVWPWCRAKASQDPAAAARALRHKALIQAIVTAVVGAALYFLFKHALAAYIVWGIAAFVLVTGFLVQPVFRAMDRLMQRFGIAVGTGLTYLLLVPFFYLVFMPGRLLMNVLGKDPLRLARATASPSCWSVRKPLKPDHFKKQF